MKERFFASFRLLLFVEVVSTCSLLLGISALSSSQGLTPPEFILQFTRFASTARGFFLIVLVPLFTFSLWELSALEERVNTYVVES